MAEPHKHITEPSFPIVLPTDLRSPPRIEIEPSTEADCIVDSDLETPEESSSSRSSTNALHKVSLSSLSNLTYDINAHFAKKQRSNVDCQDSMSVVRKLSDKLSLAPRDRKQSSESEIRSKISETEDALITFLPCVVALSDDSLDEGDSGNDDGEDEGEQRTQKMKRSLLWIRKELLDLRKKDHVIAQQFMTIRNEIQRLRLLQTVEEHRNMLDDIACDAQEEKEYTASSLCEPFGLMQYGPIAPPLLRDICLTKRDISERRFSLG